MVTPERVHDGRGGFVLVTSLLIMVVLAGLGAGAFFLTNMNLRLAENTRTSTIAHYNAHEGLDIALLALAREYYERANGSWPSLAQLQARVPVDSPYAVVSLVMDAPNAEGFVMAGTVTVRGMGPRGAEYETGARFQGELTPHALPTEADPLFGIGWVTDAQIQINGNTSFRIPLWAGNQMTGSSTKVLANAGNFARSGFVPGMPHTAANAAACTIHGHSQVSCDRGQTPPSVQSFNFDAELARMVEDRPTCSITVTSNTTLSATSYPNGTICLEANVTLILTGNATGLHVRGPRSSTLDLRAGSTPCCGQPDGRGIKVAVGTLLMGNGNADLTGMNTLFAANDISVRSVGASALGGSTVTTLMATEGDVELVAVRGTLYSTIWANGSVCKQGGGGLSFSGTILARGDDPRPGTLCNDRNRGIYWNGGGGGTFSGVSNVDLPAPPDSNANEYTAAGIRVLARRP